MRDPAFMAAFEKTIFPAYQIDAFLKPEEVRFLIDMFNTMSVDPAWAEYLHDYRGPRNAELSLWHGWPVNQPLQDLLKGRLEALHGGPFEVAGGQLYMARAPYSIHSDNRHDDPTMRMPLFLFPLWVENEEPTGVVFFKQFNLGTRARFYGGQQIDPANRVNKRASYTAIVEYEGRVAYLGEGEPISETYHAQHLHHVPFSNLEGLAIDKVLPFTPGSLIVCDQRNLHTSLAFEGFGAKIGLALFAVSS